MAHYNFLIESALLTHGIASVSDEMLLSAWPENLDNIAWIEHGEIRISDMKDYLPFRAEAGDGRAGEGRRINCFNLQEALDNKWSGALTASGAMEVCRRRGIGLAVACGMGGISKASDQSISSDLYALKSLPVALIATSPKDMMDLDATFSWLKDNGIRVIGIDSEYCTGYLFRLAGVRIDQVTEPQDVRFDPNTEPQDVRFDPDTVHQGVRFDPYTVHQGVRIDQVTELQEIRFNHLTTPKESRRNHFTAVHRDCMGQYSAAHEREKYWEKILILNPIPEEKRLTNLSILEKADELGKAVAAGGGHYHPAVNNEIDRLSGGYAAKIQLNSLIRNAELAEQISFRMQ